MIAAFFFPSSLPIYLHPLILEDLDHVERAEVLSTRQTTLHPNTVGPVFPGGEEEGGVELKFEIEATN